MRSAPQRREFLVFTEGIRTEPGYLLYWRRELRDSVLVTVSDFHGGPLQLVKAAVAAKKDELRESRRGRGKPHDEVWCVFDRDEHLSIPEAMDLARVHGIGVVISDPCSELWFNLHFEDQTAFLHRDAAQSRCEALLGGGKVLTQAAGEVLGRRYSEARARALALEAKHKGDGSPPHSNPSSNMWELVDRLRADP